MFGFNLFIFEDFYCFPDGFNFELGSTDPIMVVAQIYLQQTFLFGFFVCLFFRLVFFCFVLFFRMRAQKIVTVACTKPFLNHL